MNFKILILGVMLFSSLSLAENMAGYYKSEEFPPDAVIGGYFNSTDEDEKFGKSIGYSVNRDGIYSLFFTYIDLDEKDKTPQIKSVPIRLVRLNTGYWLVYHFNMMGKFSFLKKKY